MPLPCGSRWFRTWLPRLLLWEKAFGDRQQRVGVRDLLGSLVRGPKLASPAKTHHGRSLELSVTVGRLWARCGHGHRNCSPPLDPCYRL